MTNWINHTRSFSFTFLQYVPMSLRIVNYMTLKKFCNLHEVYIMNLKCTIIIFDNELIDFNYHDKRSKWIINMLEIC